MDLGVTGTQVGMADPQFLVIEGIMADQPWARLHHGLCEGVDEEVHWLGVELGYQIVGHPPINKSKLMRGNEEVRKTFDAMREPKEYLVCNHDIVDESDYLIVVPKGYTEELRSGTWATYRYAKKMNTPGIIVFPDGTTKEF